jgi:hypothetical protein
MKINRDTASTDFLIPGLVFLQLDSLRVLLPSHGRLLLAL